MSENERQSDFIPLRATSYGQRIHHRRLPSVVHLVTQYYTAVGDKTVQLLKRFVSVRSRPVTQNRKSSPVVKCRMRRHAAGKLKSNGEDDIEEDVAVGRQISQYQRGDTKSKSRLFRCVVVADKRPECCNDEGPGITPSQRSLAAEWAAVVLGEGAVATIFAELMQTSGEDWVHETAVADRAHVAFGDLDRQKTVADER